MHVVAYHCGSSKISRDGFSLDTLGSGEGNAALGPGVYFATDKGVGSMYCRDGKLFYQVKIDMADVYDPFLGFPEKFRGIGDKMRAVIEKARGRKLLRGSPLSDGPHDFGDIVRTIGADEARELFLRNGIRGLYTNLPAGGLEIAIFDLDVVSDIKVVDPMELPVWRR